MKINKKFTKNKLLALNLILILFLLFIFVDANFIRENIFPYSSDSLTLNYDKYQAKEILIKKDVINELNYRYQNTDVEIAFCLGGKEYDDRIIITKVEEMMNTVNTLDSVVMKDNSKCRTIKNNEMLGLLHFHLSLKNTNEFEIKSCKPSDRDFVVFGVFLNTYSSNFKLNIVQCWENTLYISNYYEDSLKPMMWSVVE